MLRKKTTLFSFPGGFILILSHNLYSKMLKISKITLNLRSFEGFLRF